MKVTILKISRRKEVINREELTNVAMAIREGSVAKEVKLIRQVYHLMRTERQEDGQVLTDFSLDIHPFKPLKSVPEETIQAMRTEIFLKANYFMRKNLMTGVAEYRERYSNDQTYKAAFS